MPIYSLSSHLQPFTSNIHTKIKVTVLSHMHPPITCSPAYNTPQYEKKKRTKTKQNTKQKKNFPLLLLALSLWFNRPIDDIRPPLTCPKPHRILCNIANTPNCMRNNIHRVSQYVLSNYIVLHLLTIQQISNQQKLCFFQQNLLGHTKNNLHPNAIDLRYLQATTLT